MEFALGNLSLLQQEIICFISYTLCAYECLTYFQWAVSLCSYRFRCNYKHVQRACNTCTLAFCLVHRFIVVVKISCGCYVFVNVVFFSCPSHLLSRFSLGRIVFPLLAYQFRSHSKGFVAHFLFYSRSFFSLSISVVWSDKNVVIECIEFIRVVKRAIPCSV